MRAPSGSQTQPRTREISGPLFPTHTGDPERGTANDADQDLTSNLCSERLDTIRPYQKGRTDGGDHHKVPIPQHVLENENNQLSVQAARIERVADLGKHKCVEDERPSNRVIAFLQRGVINVVTSKYFACQGNGR